MKNYPSLRQIQYFIALAESLSFSKAAETCFVTQSTLSTGIKELETLLGRALFERSSRKVLLTPFGKVFWAEAEKMIDQADQMIDRMQLVQDDPSGPFTIGFIPTIAPYYASAFMNKVKDAYPKLEPIIIEGLSDDLLHKLNMGDIDAAILALPYDIGDFEYEILEKDPFFLVASPKMGLSNPISLKDISCLDLTLLEDGHCLSDQAIFSCALNADLKKQRNRISNIYTLLSITASEGKATLLTEMMYDSTTLKKQGLERIDIKGIPPSRDIALIWRKTTDLKEYLPKIF